MINPEIAIPLVVALATAVAMFYRWLNHRERMAELAAERDRPNVDSAGLVRLEQAVEAVAVEVERIGEGQRFVTRALAERGVTPLEPKPNAHGRVVTPH